MWIRTQDRHRLIKVSDIEYVRAEQIHFLVSNGSVLAAYPTEERCLEVLDEVQGHINSNLSRNEGIARNVIPQVAVYQMPKE